MADRYHDMRVGHFRALPGHWRPHQARHRHTCPRAFGHGMGPDSTACWAD